LSELRFEELPGIPKIWVDFLNSTLSALPASSAIHTLAERAAEVRRRSIPRDDIDRIFIGSHAQRSVKASQNIQQLRQQDSVVVSTNLYPSLFGGPGFQILKCLTAIKVCDELSKRAISALPVCWIDAAPPIGFSVYSIHLLDSESGLHRLQFPQPDTKGFLPTEQLSLSQISLPISQIKEIGQGTFDPEMVEILKASFRSGITMAQATGHLIAALTEEWGMIVVDSSAPEFQSVLPQTAYEAPSGERTYLFQSSLLPVISCVIDPGEVSSFISAQSFFDKFDLVQPLAWPQTSATIMDIRSRRTLERYNLELRRLYSGEQTIMSDLQNAMPRTVGEKLGSLRAEIETQIAGLKALNTPGKEFSKTLDSGREKVLFQIDKLAGNFESAYNRKLETARRQIHKACNFLAPGGKLQERELAGIQMPLRYSRSVLRSLYEKLDILNSEHQIILMD
jgi:uncharacterized protein YllA (UPF0747 family)